METSPVAQDVIQRINSSFVELDRIWNHIGYEPEERSKRIDSLSDKLQKVLLNEIQDENKLRIELETQMDAMNRQISEVCQTLRLPPFFPPRDLSTNKLLKVLNNKVNELETLKKERINQYSNTYTKIVNMCQCLNIDDPNPILEGLDPRLDPNKQSDIVDGIPSPIPAEEDLKRIQTKLQDLESKYQLMFDKFNTFRKDIVRIAQDISYQPADEFETSVLNTPDNIEFSDLSPHIKMTEETIQKVQEWRLKLVKQKAMLVGNCEELRNYLQNIWRRLNTEEKHRKRFIEENSGYKPETMENLQAEVDRCQEKKWDKIDFYLNNLRQEAEELYNKCFLSIIEQPAAVQDAFDASCDCEEAANTLEVEIERLQEIYNSNAQLYDTVNIYQTVWQNYLDVEQKMKDPAILSNRGGVLLKTEKEKKRILKELPKIEQEVAKALEENPQSQNFRLNGRTFSEHVAWLWQEFKSNQEEKSNTIKSRRSSRLSVMQNSFNGNISNKTSLNELESSPKRPSSSRR